MEERSRLEIERWAKRINKNEKQGIDDMNRYRASRIIGRDFNETVERYFERQGLTEFNKWATEITKAYENTPLLTKGVDLLNQYYAR